MPDPFHFLLSHHMDSAKVAPVRTPPPKVEADFVEIAEDTPEFRALFEEGKNKYLLSNIKAKFRPFDVILFGKRCL
jgi:hypothetical protein